MAYVIGQLYNAYRTYLIEYSGKKNVDFFTVLLQKKRKFKRKVFIEMKF